MRHHRTVGHDDAAVKTNLALAPGQKTPRTMTWRSSASARQTAAAHRSSHASLAGSNILLTCSACAARPDSQPKRYSKVGGTSPARCASPVDFRPGGDELDSYEAQYHTQAAVARSNSVSKEPVRFKQLVPDLVFGHTMNTETQRTDILNERLAAILNEANFTVEYRKNTRDGVSAEQLREIYFRQKQQAVVTFQDHDPRGFHQS